jgi:DNA-nicking Smr family endonuclease
MPHLANLSQDATLAVTCPHCKYLVNATVFGLGCKFICEFLNGRTQLGEIIRALWTIIEKDSIIRIAIQNRLDVRQIKRVLSNILDCYTCPAVKSLTTEDKESIYRLSRNKLEKMYGKLNELKQISEKIEKTSANKKFRSKIKKLNSEIVAERSKSAREVFTRMNSAGDMGFVGQDGVVTIDLHGLHVDEAQSILEEFVIPLMSNLRNMRIVTGVGKHSKGGFGVLKWKIKVRVSLIQ